MALLARDGLDLDGSSPNVWVGRGRVEVDGRRQTRDVDDDN